MDGIASHCETLIKGLRDRGVSVVLFSGSVNWNQETVARHENLKALAVEWIQLNIPAGRLAYSFQAAGEIARGIRRHHLQVLHIHGLSALPLARGAVLKTRTPIVVTCHPSGTSSPGPGKLSRRLIRAAQPLLRRFVWPDRAIALSSELQNWFTSDVRMSPARVERIFSGVDSAYFRPPTVSEKSAALSSFQVGRDELVCCLVGRLEPVKRHDVLLAAVKSLVARGHSIRVLLAGSGELRGEVEKFVEENNLQQHVTFCGHRSDIRNIYWASDAIVLPSEREGFPIVIIEAMLCGVIPLRTPAAGAYDQIEPGKTGFVFPFGDSAQLADRLQTLMLDRPAKDRMSATAAVTAARRFDARTMVCRTHELYESALGNG